MNLANFRLIAAPFTPMKHDGSLNLALVRDQAKYLVSNSVRGVFLAGTSGEGQSLTVDERMALAEAWAGDAVRRELQVFVHVGHNCRDDAIRLARHAVSVSADAVAVHAPSWFKPQTLEGLIEFCVPIAAAAPTLPFYLYDIPEITGVSLPSSSFLANAKELIPNLAGVKYTNPDLAAVQECIQMNMGAYDILWGADPALLAGIAFGAMLAGITWLWLTRDWVKCLLVFAFGLAAWLVAVNTASEVFSNIVSSDLFGTTPGAKDNREILGLLLGGLAGGAAGSGLATFG
ncbi:MAG: dihydrodipicolinate synthase family protein, partial [Pirellulales bacterium]